MSRSGLAGPPASLTAGLAFCVPPLLKFGSPQLQERLLPDLLTCKKRTCLAITEPDAGSDVANITTTAAKSADGRHYIINGSKKWWVGFLLFSKGRRNVPLFGAASCPGTFLHLFMPETN